MDKKLIKSTAESLGYNDKVIRKASLGEAMSFMNRVASRCPENVKHDVLYAAQALINTITWEVAEKAVQQEEAENE